MKVSVAAAAKADGLEEVLRSEDFNGASYESRFVSLVKRAQSRYQNSACSAC